MKIRTRNHKYKITFRKQWVWSNPEGHPFTFLGPIVVRKFKRG